VSADAILRVDGLSMYFPIFEGLLRKQVGEVKAVDDVSFTINRGETLGLVGESGCGKSTTGRTILKLYQPTAGRIELEGKDITDLSGDELRQTRPHMQMIFQDPQACLNPRMTVGSIIGEPLDEHTRLKRRQKRERVRELLDSVGMNPDFENRYPHEFSALDVSIQAQVVNLLEDLQTRHNLTYLFISHDLSMVRHIADQIAVMYLGKLVELAPRDQLYAMPQHPYTKALLSAVPEPDPAREATRERIILQGDVPSPASPPDGCNFSTRCPIAEDRCRRETPAWRELEGGRYVACHMVQ